MPYLCLNSWQLHLEQKIRKQKQDKRCVDAKTKNSIMSYELRAGDVPFGRVGRGAQRSPGNFPELPMLCDLLGGWNDIS